MIKLEDLKYFALEGPKSLYLRIDKIENGYLCEQFGRYNEKTFLLNITQVRKFIEEKKTECALR